MNEIKQNSPYAWFLAARPKTLTGAIIPVLLGSALAFSDGQFKTAPALLCALFACGMQIAANFINDLFDFQKGTDRREDRLGPQRACAEGWITPAAMKTGIGIALTLSCLAGLAVLFTVWGQLPHGGWELVVLGVVMWQVNKDDVVAEPTSQPAATETLAPEATEAPDDDMPVGYEVRMKCPDFTVPLYGEEGGEFTLSAQKGKVTVINFWATWCTPCVAELPYFAELYAEYGDEISLVAIHSNLVTDDVDKFLAKENLNMPFALDKTGAVIKSLGGSTQLPMTVIVDAAGKIVYNKVGSVTLTVLEGLVAPLLAE